MKRPQPDIGDLLRQDFISNVGTVRKFMRLWGTTDVGGVEVFTPRQFYYPAGYRSANFEKLFRYLGAYDDVKDYKGEGVDKAWLFLNKNKASEIKTSSYPNQIPEFVAENLNLMWWDPADGAMPAGLTLTTDIVIEPDEYLARQYPSSTTVNDILALGLTKEQLKTSVATNFDDLWLTSRIVQQGVGIINKGSITDPVTNVVTPDEDDLTPDDPWMATAARYALRSTAGISCTVKRVDIGLGLGREFNDSRVDNTLAITIEIPYLSFTQSSPMVVAVAADLGVGHFNPTSAPWGSIYNHVSSVVNSFVTQKAIKAMDKSDLADDPSLVSRPYALWEDVSDAIYGTTNYNSLWYGGYLKAAPFKDPRAYGYTYKELAKYLLPLIDNDYKKEKVSFWKKALAIVIFVVLVVFAPFTGGASLKFGAVLKAIIAAGLVLTLATMVLSAMGQAEWATAFAEAQKTVEPLIMIATIITVINGIKKKFAVMAAKKAVERTVVEAVKDMVVDFIEDFVDNLIQGYTEMVAGQITELSLSFANKMVDLINIMGELRLESINDRNKDLKAEYSKIMEESTQENDVLRNFMYIYPKPATADWSMYASLFDQPYERSGGTLALGNVQRTTKQALRKADYSDPVFANTLIV